jgi:gamma-glutamyltranspeptidase
MQRLWEDLDDGDAYIEAGGSERAAILAAAMRKVYGQTDGDVSVSEYASTGLIAVDKDGSGVACTITMGHPFGARVSAGKSGIVLATAPPEGHSYGVGIVPMVGVNRPFLAISKSVDTLYFLTAGSAETAAGPNQLAAAIPMFEDGISLDQALALPRIRSNRDTIEYESGMPGQAIAAMRSRSLSARSVDSIGRIHAVFCPGGFSSGDSASCQMRVDKRSFGLVARGE